MKPRKFSTFNDGIQHYMNVQQFARVAGKIEGLHALQEQQGKSREIDNAIQYYQKEKEILLGMMKECLDKSVVVEEVE